MRPLFASLYLLLSVSGAFAALSPLTVKDLSLMLRTGYTTTDVERETTRRHFTGTIDAAAEESLRVAGLSSSFIERLKSGAYAVPPAELAAAEAENAATAKRRAAQAEQARQFNTLYQTQQAEARAKAARAALPENVIAPLLKGDLVLSRNGLLTSYIDQTMEKKKLIAFYFSAHWCAPCRRFTPELVAYYNRVAPAHPEFEVVFVSYDRSAPAMESYMRDAQMPWPGVIYDKIAGKEALLKYAGTGIPCLVLVDPSGQVISDSYSGSNYLGPSKVLADLDQLLGVQTAAK